MQCTTYKFVLMVVLCTIIFANAKKKKSEHRFNRTRPGEMKDRIKKEKRHEEKKHGEIWKPIMSEAWVNKHRTPHHPAWMDYCEPYHCNDYHRPACGLNNNTMRFRYSERSVGEQAPHAPPRVDGLLRAVPLQRLPPPRLRTQQQHHEVQVQ
ncbi:uncharacterized protein LOC128198023 isoform X3 [Bicyclus anynana]|uniref:Uncharacterized protein LOC128198023 isoform X3 n=1 Tax=Bicyclus anynana TaxID=110368 RepID=A0ABM3M5V5_BICAN|nr:uncharacterized protein LOC128198023 isoform X3 [Bicyclus anynana]